MRNVRLNNALRAVALVAVVIVIYIAIIELQYIINMKKETHYMNAHYTELAGEMTKETGSEFILTKYKWTSEGVKHFTGVSTNQKIEWSLDGVNAVPFSAPAIRPAILLHVPTVSMIGEFIYPDTEEFKLVPSTSAPYAYVGERANLINYIYYLYSIGFEEQSVEADSDVLDIKLRKRNMLVRIIMTTNTLHLFTKEL